MQISDIKNIAIIGLGTMGPGIAQAFALAGYRVRGYDSSPAASETCQRIIEANLKTLNSFGTVDPEASRMALTSIDYTDNLATAAADAHIIIEAVTENRDVKRSVYEQIDHFAPAGSLIWSNTSTLNIFELMPEVRLADTLIAHWFAPPHIIPLVEVVKGPGSSPLTVELTLEMLRSRLSKIPIVIEKYVPGFIINRILRNLGREAFFLLDGGYISPEDLDLAVKASIAPRMMVLGLIQRYDFTGLDLSARNLLDPNFFDPPTDNRPKALHSKIDQGHLGVKTGRGFYDYSDRDLPDVLKDRDHSLLRVMESLSFCLTKNRLV